MSHFDDVFKRASKLNSELAGRHVRHYARNTIYLIRGVDVHATTLEIFVAYTGTDARRWTRPYSEWIAEPEPGVPRYAFVSEEEWVKAPIEGIG